MVEWKERMFALGAGECGGTAVPMRSFCIIGKRSLCRQKQFVSLLVELWCLHPARVCGTKCLSVCPSALQCSHKMQQAE